MSDHTDALVGAEKYAGAGEYASADADTSRDTDPRGGVANDVDTVAYAGELAARAPGRLLHARVVRPPSVRWDGRRFASARPVLANEAPVRAMPGVDAVVVHGHFVAIVAETPIVADDAAARLVIDWRPSGPEEPRHDHDTARARNDSARSSAEAARRRHTTAHSDATAHGSAPPAARDTVVRHGDVDAALAAAHMRLGRTYRWPVDSAPAQAPATQPQPVACAAALYRDGNVTIWTGHTSPRVLRTEIAALLALSDERVVVVSGAHGGERELNGATDLTTSFTNDDANRHAAADAALLSRIVGNAVQVRLYPHDLQLDSDISPCLVTSIDSGTNADGTIGAYAVSTQPPPRIAPPLAQVLAGEGVAAAAIDDARERIDARAAGDAEAPDVRPSTRQATAMPPYAFAAVDIASTESGAMVCIRSPHDIASLATVFAHESHLDEVAASLAIDPVELRLRHLDDARGAALIERTVTQAQWKPRRARAAGRSIGGADTASAIRQGRGFAYARTIDANDSHVWSAWVADVQVDTVNGDVTVTRVVVGHDAALDGPAAAHQAPRTDRVAVARTIERLTTERRFDDASSAPSEANANGASDVARAIAPAHAPRPQPTAIDIAGPDTNVATPAHHLVVPLQGSAAAMLPAAAAIANAIHDATGVRLREPPFSADRIRRALEDERRRNTRAAVRGRTRNTLVALAAAAAGALASVMPWRTSIAPVAPPDPGFYSAAAIERGRRVFAAADCAVCHTARDGARNAGGLPLDTPFGTIYSTNITPDPQTGIGNWSYEAFERAMRHGIHRDGHRLYPAFPYTSYAKMTDGDMRALYAYVMSQPPVHSTPPATRLAFPFNVRALLAGWDLLFHRATVYRPDPARSVEWNRGAYLVDALGHCGACHSPRNALGAERRGPAYLTGGVAEGWEAPPLAGRSHAPVEWTRDDFYDYLRSGYSANHGAAAGPMAQVVREMAGLPDSDVRAIATYLASLNPAAPSTHEARAQAVAIEQRDIAQAATMTGLGARLYSGACAVCHDANGPQLLGVKPALALNSNLRSASPDNVLRVLLNGIADPPHPDIGYMPAFRDTFDDRQIAALTSYLRARFAPDRPAWTNVEERVARLRAEPAAH